MKDNYAVSLCILFFVDIDFYSSRLREGRNVKIAKKKCWGEREERNVLGTWKECFGVSFLSVGHNCTSVL